MYTLKYHNDINMDIDKIYDIVINGKVITVGHSNFDKMYKWIQNLEEGEIVIVRLLSKKRAKENPDKPYLLKCKFVSKYEELLGNLEKHMELFLPEIRKPGTKLNTRKRHNWFDTWNADTKVFCVKIDNITETYTYNDLKDVINQEQYKDFKKPFTVATGRTFVRYK